MVKAQEKISVIIMRDSGESKRYRWRRARFRALILFCVMAPLVAAGALTACFYLWQENRLLLQNLSQLQEENSVFAATAKRLENLQSLLERKKNVERAVMAKVMQENISQETVDFSDPKVQSDLQAEGPGHEAFPAQNTGELKIDNVSASRLEQNRLRVAFNLHNLGAESLSGEAFTILSLADGRTVPLKPNPADAGTYKISKFKSAVLFISLDQEYDLTNAQIILEVKNDKDELVFRNIFPLSQ